MIAMGIIGFGALAPMSTSDYFAKANLVAETRGDHIKLRSAVTSVLSLKQEVGCTERQSGNGKNCCADDLRLLSGSSVRVPAFNSGTPPPILAADNIELRVTMGSAGGDIISTTDPSTNPNAVARNQRFYKVVLVGDFRAKSRETNGAIYSGGVSITGTRTSAVIKGPPMTALVPLEFEIDASGELTSCVVRPNQQTLAGSNSNSYEHCLQSGGIPIPSNVGNLCRFRRLTPISGGTLPCPAGFTGDANEAIGCTVNTSTSGFCAAKIPECPSGSTRDPAPAPGQVGQGEPSLQNGRNSRAIH